MTDPIAQVLTAFIITDLLDGDQGTTIDIDTPLFANGILDSFSLLSLLSFISAHYRTDIHLIDCLPSDFETVRSLANLIERNMSNINRS